MRGNWRKLTFEEALVDETGGNVRTQQSDFIKEGRYPIIDQGKVLIAGYTDDPNRLCKARLPVIVFGDHTRSFKFVDFPFCLGADGTKILRPRIEAHEKFLFHYLRQIRIPDAGYDRHFKYLKRAEIWLPPLDEQRSIAAILDQAEELRQKRRQALERFSPLQEAVFAGVCSPTTPLVSIGSAIDLGILLLHKDGNHGSLYPRAEDFGGEGVPFVSAKSISESGYIEDLLTQRLSESKAASLRHGWIMRGDVLLAHNATVGKVGLIVANMTALLWVLH
jgi:type I restriction enzyme S subunit